MRCLVIMMIALLVTLPAQAAKNSEAKACKVNKVVMNVDGMVCDFCTRSVEAEMRKEKDVTDVKIDLSAKTVTLLMKPDAKLDDASLLKKIDYAGYKTTNIARSCAE